ncbi:MAG: hypothetical protein ACK56S_12440 [Planctomycetota bacterium]
MPNSRILVAFALALTAGGLIAQTKQLTLPDNHYLSESPTQLGNTGSGIWWRAAGPSRFQIVYDASHFLGNSGVTGPITLTKIKFRGEDAEANLGGQVYTGVNVQVGSTSLAAGGLSTTFATNLAPAAPNTTTMSAVGTTNVTVAPSLGSMPNNWNIELDLVAMGIATTFNPLGSEPNLLLDVTIPAAPSNAPPLALILLQNTTGTLAQIRGQGLTATTTTATTGTLSGIPLVVGVEVTGPGGYTTVVPATNEAFGGACGGSASSFYQGFVNGQQFDLGAGLTMLPDSSSAPTSYTVISGAPAPDLTKVNASPNLILDDAVVSFPLGFTFPFPGGSTQTIVPSTNGFIWLDPLMTDNAFAAVAARLLGDPVTGTTAPLYSGGRLAIYWTDLNMQRNVGLNGSAGLHIQVDTSGGAGNNVCYVTWWDVATFNVVGGTGVQGHQRWTFQMVLFENGVVQFRYGSVPTFTGASTVTTDCFAALVGFSPGRIGGLTGVNAADPQNRDLSLETPFTTRPEGGAGNIGQRAITAPNAGGGQYGGRLYPGQTATWNAVNVPAGTVLGAQLLDIAATRPGLQVPTITAPGCMLSTSTGATVWELFVLPTATATGTVSLAVPTGLSGVTLYSQFVTLGGLFGAPDLVTSSSNAIQQVIGLN